MSNIEDDHADSCHFQQADFSTSIKNCITLKSQVGSGAFSNVYLGSYKGEIVAIKKQKREEGSDSIQSYIWRELTVLKYLQHPHLLNYIGAYDDFEMKEVWIVTEFVKGGDLGRILKRDDAAKLGWRTRVQIAADAAAGLAYLHDNGFIHRDIKTANMLIDENWRCKLCDFGFARKTGRHKPTRRMTLCGTDAYMAPEIYFDEEYDQRVDVFSFGVALIELITLEDVNVEDFLARTPQKLFQIDFQQLQKYIPEDCPKSLVLLTESCISQDMETRPTSTEVSEWLNDLLEELPFEENQLTLDISIDLGENNQQEESWGNNEILKEITNASLDMSVYEAPHHIGWLFKQNRRGRKLWTQRWFLLDGGVLKYYKSLAEVRSTTVQKDNNSICLQGCGISKGSNFQFQIICPENGIKKQLAASSFSEMNKWLNALQEGIIYANAKSNNSEVRARTHIKSSSPEDKELEEWLEQLQMLHHLSVFQEKGYVSLNYLKETGIEDDDLNFLNIQDPKERTILMEAAQQLREEE